jgi:hypothetical protein
MRKILFTVMWALATVSFLQAQLVVSDAGKVGIKLPNATDNPLSELSIGSTGSTSSLVMLNGSSFSGKYAVLSVSSTSLSSSQYSASYGIWSSITGTSQNFFASMWGANTQGSSYAGSGYGYGVVGIAGNYSKNYGVAGGLSNSTTNGAGILGQTHSSITVIPAGTYAGYFDGNVVVTGTITATNLSPSDLSYKQNVADVDGKKTLNGILSLRPVSYNLKQRYLEALEDGKAKQIPVYDEKSDLFQNKHYGLIAQELKEIYPDLVYSDAEGKLAVNYTELVPLLIESIKELNGRIEQLENSNALLRSAEQTTASGLESSLRQAALYQNAPNPFSQSTQIKFYLPESVKHASLNIYNLQGEQLKQIDVAARGENSQSITGSELKAGIYLYALIADGQEVDVKRMILTK